MMRTILIFFLFCNLCHSQIDTLSLSFYPLNTGDYWEYQQVVYSWDMTFPPTYDTTYYSMEILGDTLMSNLRSYKIIKKTNLDLSSIGGNGYYYERIDSSSCNVYQFSEHISNNEYLIDSLKSVLNDTSHSSHDLMFGFRNLVKTVCTDISINNYFSVQKYSKHFEADVLYPFQYDLIEDIGLFSFLNSFDFGWMKIELKFATIEGITFGEKVTLVDNPGGNIAVPNFNLQQNYPNPFNNKTIIPYYLKKSMSIQIDLYSITGEKLFNIFKGVKSFGYHSTELNADALPSGIYFYTMMSGNFISSKKCLLIK